jgi:hypothetical protein
VLISSDNGATPACTADKTSAGTLRMKSMSRAQAPIIVAHLMTTHNTSELS